MYNGLWGYCEADNYSAFGSSDPVKVVISLVKLYVVILARLVSVSYAIKAVA